VTGRKCPKGIFKGNLSREDVLGESPERKRTAEYPREFFEVMSA